MTRRIIALAKLLAHGVLICLLFSAKARAIRIMEPVAESIPDVDVSVPIGGVEIGASKTLDALRYGKEYNLLWQRGHITIKEEYLIRNGRRSVLDTIVNETGAELSSVHFYDEMGHFMKNHPDIRGNSVYFHTRHRIGPGTKYAYSAAYKFIKQKVISTVKDQIIIEVDLLPISRVDRVLNTEVTVLLPPGLKILSINKPKSLPPETTITIHKARKRPYYARSSTVVTLSMPNTVVIRDSAYNNIIDITCQDSSLANIQRSIEETFSYTLVAFIVISIFRLLMHVEKDI